MIYLFEILRKKFFNCTLQIYIIIFFVIFIKQELWSIILRKNSRLLCLLQTYTLSLYQKGFIFIEHFFLSLKNFLTPEHPDQVRVNKFDSCTIWNSIQLPGQRKFHQGGRQQFQHSVLGNSQHVGARFGHFQPHHL